MAIFFVVVMFTHSVFNDGWGTSVFLFFWLAVAIVGLINAARELIRLLGGQPVSAEGS